MCSLKTCWLVLTKSKISQLNFGLTGAPCSFLLLTFSSKLLKSEICECFLSCPAIFMRYQFWLQHTLHKIWNEREFSNRTETTAKQRCICSESKKEKRKWEGLGAEPLPKPAENKLRLKKSSSRKGIFFLNIHKFMLFLCIVTHSNKLIVKNLIRTKFRLKKRGRSWN